MSTEALEFVPWPKIPRLNRDIIITEKIDGTNAAVVIRNDGVIYAQSRTRVIEPGKTDNAGFAAWVQANKETLWEDLGPGRHFGEWWGSGIQRGYGAPKGEKFFSLFNTSKWAGQSVIDNWDEEARFLQFTTDHLYVVPVLYRGLFSQAAVEDACEKLREFGSFAFHGYGDPEGVVVFHTASNEMYKVLLKNDQIPKSFQ